MNALSGYARHIAGWYLPQQGMQQRGQATEYFGDGPKRMKLPADFFRQSNRFSGLTE